MTPIKLKHRAAQKKAEKIQADRNSVMMHEVVNPCADARIAGIPDHAEIRHEKEQRINPPWIRQLGKEKNGKHKKGKSFKFQ